MALHEQLLADLAGAMKAQDTETLSTLRMVKAALLNAQKAQGGNELLSDDVVLAILAKEVKKRKESAAAFRDAGREELAVKEDAECAIIERYVPAQASDEEIRAAVQEVIATMGGDNFGAVMGAAMKKLSGTADGNRVKAIVQECLPQS